MLYAIFFFLRKALKIGKLMSRRNRNSVSYSTILPISVADVQLSTFTFT